MIRSEWSMVAGIVLAAGLAIPAQPARAQAPAYLADRGDGIRTSLLATYIRPKELIVYPFYEYTRTKNLEYKPSDFGFVGGVDREGGKLVENEFLLFLGYAFNDSWAVEFESAVHTKAHFTKAANDTNPVVPQEIRESGLGDTEAQIRWRYAKETETRPDITFFFESVFPLQRNKRLLGTRKWEFATGAVLTKGFSFGTLSARASINYERADRKFGVGEYAIDYLKQLSPNWKLALSLEGEDELSVIGELQYALARNATLKLNCGFGLSKVDRTLAPEIGVLFRF